MVAQDGSSVKPDDGSPASSGTSSAGEAKGVKQGAASPSRNKNNTNINNKNVMPAPYPHPPHPAIHYYPAYPPPPYDHVRAPAAVGAAASKPPTTTSSEQNSTGQHASRGSAAPYASAQFDRLNPPPSGIIPPSHYSGVAGTKTGSASMARNSSEGGASVGGEKASGNASGNPPETTSAGLAGIKAAGIPLSSSSRDPPPPMTAPPHHYPPHPHYPGYHPPPPHHAPSRDDRAAAAVHHHHHHHQRAWAEYHHGAAAHFYDPTQHAPGAGGAAPPPYPPPPGTYRPPQGGTPVGKESVGAMGPYRFSDTTLRRDALSQLQKPGINPQSQEYKRAMEIMNMDAGDREGATSPSQIETIHREEVTTMGCTCKKTKCLKLYCQCFAVKIYCGVNCRCMVCHNVETHEKERLAAIRSILSRNPQAFEVKFKKAVPDQTAVELAHKLGCKCRKSACMKKYCECYAGGVKCSDNCRCVGCKNGGGNEDRPGKGSNGSEVTVKSAMNAGPLAPTLIAAIAGQPADIRPQPSRASPAAGRRREPYMMDAAHNLAFLKHASPVPNKKGGPRRTLSHDAEASVPSLASSATSPNDSNLEEEEYTISTAEKKRSVSEAPNTAERTAVNALLMAAAAMPEFAEQPVVKPEPTQDNAPLSTPPDIRMAKVDESQEEYETPQKNLFKQFQSPKRKQSDTDLQDIKDHGPMRGGGTSSSESSPSGADDNDNEEESPKRELAEMTVTPSVAQKIKRSRVGSLIKEGPNRNLGREMAVDETGSRIKTAASPMMMETPKQKKTTKVTELTPVSARCIDFKRMQVNGSPDVKDGQ